MKKLLLLMLVGTFCFCTACQGSSNQADSSVTPDSNAEIDTASTEVAKDTITPDTEVIQDTEIIQDTTIPNTEDVGQSDSSSESSDDDSPLHFIALPLPATIDLCNPTDCTLAIGLDAGNAYKDDTGAMQLKVTVYTYDLYDMVDISMLKEGDIIRLNQEDILIESITRNDTGSVSINGGLDMGGYELYTDENTVYYEIGYSDVKSYYAVGEIIVPVSADFVFTDHSDLDNGPLTYSAEEFFSETSDVAYYFAPHNTTLRIEGGYAVEMQRIYTP